MTAQGLKSRSFRLRFASALLLLACWTGKTNGSPTDACGGPPIYCARSDMNVAQETPMNPPVVNAVVTDPDFGSRMLRVTDANTLASFGFAGRSYKSTSSSEQNTWSADGTRFYVEADGGLVVPFSFNPITLTASRITVPGSQTGGLPLATDAAFSYVDPDVIYSKVTTQPLQIGEYRFSTNTTSVVYDTRNCAVQPSLASDALIGGMSISGTDNQFAVYEGGTEQDLHMLVVVYDKTAGGCRWFNTQTGQIGGDWGPAGTALNPVATTPSAPTLTSVKGGALAANTYYVRITLLNPFGESTESKEMHLAVKAHHLLAVNPPPAGSNVTAYNVYVGTSMRHEQLQNKSPLALGARWTEPKSGLVSGPAVAAANTTASGFLIHNARISRGGDYVRIERSGGGLVAFWQIGALNVSACSTSASPWCGGHHVMGYSHDINASGYLDDMNIFERPMANISATQQLINPLLSPVEWSLDKHWSWNNVNSNDNVPVCGSTYQDVGPPVLITRAWDREILCLRTDGVQSEVWRFAHNRSLGMTNGFWGTPRGNVSQDGKFYMFTSDWENGLGLQLNSTTQHRTDVFIVELF